MYHFDMSDGEFHFNHCMNAPMLSVNAKRGRWLGASSRNWNVSTGEHLYGVGITPS
jgi:hypothetical protein